MNKLPPVEKIPEAWSAIADERVSMGSAVTKSESRWMSSIFTTREGKRVRREPKGKFYRNVYAIVGKIPAGVVATYGQIALLAGSPRAARQVGYALAAVSAGRNLPCHRVVNRLGELAPGHVFGEQGYQRMLLESEGITFLPGGRIDLKRHLWSGPEGNAAENE